MRLIIQVRGHIHIALYWTRAHIGVNTPTARGNDAADKLAPAVGAFLGGGSGASHHEDHSSGGSRIKEFAVLQLLLVPQQCYATF